MRNLMLLFLLFFSCTNRPSEGTDEKPDRVKYEVKSVADVDVLANTLKEKILSSQSNVSIRGAKYYVSNKGDDSADGLSPGKAWATLAKVSSADLKNGDAVLFERGGLWRGSFSAKTGVSYSAFGQGDKPAIYGSPQNFSVKGKWVPSGIPNVYVYDQEFVNDAGVLVFNNGEANSYKKLTGVDGFSGSPAELKNDLEMCHNTDDKRIYLYSASGNPADRFSGIEFCLKEHIIRIAGDNVTIDNLCVKYGGAHGISSGSRNGLHVTWCEFGWIGGSIQHGTTRYGNAIEIYGACKDYLVDHCYIYQIYDAGVTHQFKNPTSTETKIMENVVYSNNLFEKCIYSIEYFLDQPNSPQDVMRNITISGNICRLAGYGFGWQRRDKVARHIQGGWLNSKRKYPAENFIVEGNIFDRSIDVLLSVSALEQSHLPKMKNNIYIQNKGGKFGMVGVNYNQYYIYDENIGKLMEEKGIEKNPVVLFAD